MHDASLEKVRAFRDAYLSADSRSGSPCSVLEIGSMSVLGQDTYRQLFPAPAFAYTGLDIEKGLNVDLVPADPFLWSEIGDESFDAVISCSAFEHNPYFWITMAEISRVLVPGGLAAIVAPASGPVHRHPFDCWRFYPDSWGSLCKYVGMDLLEHFVEGPRPSVKMNFQWQDSFMVARRPKSDDQERENEYRARLTAIAATSAAMPEVDPTNNVGPAISKYQRRIEALAPASRLDGARVIHFELKQRVRAWFGIREGS